jgi:catechol 2,3-dioxygenase-like lactoylglutathione lyase family enzyme
MRIKGIVWLGTRTERFGEMRAFFRDVTGVEPRVDEPGFAVFDLASGDRLEVFGAAEDDDHAFMTAPVVGFLVDSVDDARAELETRGISFIGPVHRAPDGNAWAHFRAPDGHVYEVTEQPGHPAHDD